MMEHCEEGNWKKEHGVKVCVELTKLGRRKPNIHSHLTLRHLRR